jgi:hypothetical protein
MSGISLFSRKPWLWTGSGYPQHRHEYMWFPSCKASQNIYSTKWHLVCSELETQSFRCVTISEDLCHWVFMNVQSCTEGNVSRMRMTLNTVTTKNNCLCFQASVCKWQQYCSNKYRFCAIFKSAKNLCITCTAQVTSENENLYLLVYYLIQSFVLCQL